MLSTECSWDYGRHFGILKGREGFSWPETDGAFLFVLRGPEQSRLLSLKNTSTRSLCGAGVAFVACLSQGLVT